MYHLLKTLYTQISRLIRVDTVFGLSAFKRNDAGKYEKKWGGVQYTNFSVKTNMIYGGGGGRKDANFAEQKTIWIRNINRSQNINYFVRKTYIRWSVDKFICDQYFFQAKVLKH